MALSPLNDFSERFAFAKTRTQAGAKPACQAFGWVVSGGVFRPGLLYTPEQVRVKTLTFELFEPDEKLEPVRLGQVTVKLKNQLKPCGPGQMHTGLELEVIRASR